MGRKYNTIEKSTGWNTIKTHFLSTKKKTPVKRRPMRRKRIKALTM